MPRLKGSTSGYARIAQAEEQEEEDEYYGEIVNEDPNFPQRTISYSPAQYAPIQPGQHAPMQHSRTNSSNALLPHKRLRSHKRRRSNSAVDVKAINARLERWAEEIAQKFKLRKIKGKSMDEEKLEIHYSVFQAPDDIRPATAETLSTGFLAASEQKMTKLQFDDIVESVRVAIELGMQPKMITQGSSGSYFAQNNQGKVVGVFKPKDEEPYATKNPKWTKWIHRNLFPFFFGRACLIPNLSYVSEAAAYILDTRLQTNLVPYTDIVYLSSVSFNYDFWDRRAYYRKRKPLPQKIGSFQVFLKGFQDANIFLKSHPWPDQANSTLQALSTNKNKNGRSRRWADECRPGRFTSSKVDEEEGVAGDEEQRRRRFWTEELQQSFREELEKLVVLDYIMRNTDRGLDNWMIKVDQDTQTATIVADIPNRKHEAGKNDGDGQLNTNDDVNRSQTSTPQAPSPGSTIKIGAIDNSLSWPWKHPDAWRSFPFGWLFLPVSLIGQPFSEKTRQHFIPLLTSKQWWSDTQLALRYCFNHDTDFKERMFARQMAVMKGQAWNVLETLKTPDHGPLELTRRTRVCVWDDLVDVPTVVPLREPSSEIRRKTRDRHFAGDMMEDSMDISSAVDPTAPDAATYLSSYTTNGEVKAPNPFNVSRENSTDDVHPEGTDHNTTLELSPDGRRDSPRNLTIKMQNAKTLEAQRPENQRSKSTRISYDGPRPIRPSDLDARKRNFSFTGRKPSLDSNSEHDGDLGYAAARDMEGNRKKVIVERLETVKSKSPVFTWC